MFQNTCQSHVGLKSPPMAPKPPICPAPVLENKSFRERT